MSYLNQSYTTSIGALPTTLSTTYNTTTTYTNGNAYNYGNIMPATLRVEGDAEFKGDVKIQGVSLSDRLNVIEERLGILRPNPELEGRWEKLKALGEEYRKLEKEIIEQEKTWEILKR